MARPAADVAEAAASLAASDSAAARTSTAIVRSVTIDPVCGMAVDPLRAVSVSYHGQLVHFCSRGCRDEFIGLGPAREEQRAAELVGRILDTPALLRPVFQPIVSVDSGEIAGYEALARFEAVPLQPAETWFELAAAAGLRPEIEALAIRRALEAAAERPPPAGEFLALNVSPLLLDDPRLEAAFADPAMDPARLVLELTEREQVADYEALRTVLAPYRARGFRVAVDDAGAGYASLRHITELGPDFVKLDARLIAGLNGDRARQALVRAMATFASETGAQLVAEGVASRDDVELLRRATRTILVQGYAVGRPGAPWPVASGLPAGLQTGCRPPPERDNAPGRRALDATSKPALRCASLPAHARPRA